MKFSEIQNLEVSELRKQVAEKRSELFEARMKHSQGQLNNPLVIRKLRRDIARYKTAMMSSSKGQ